MDQLSIFDIQKAPFENLEPEIVKPKVKPPKPTTASKEKVIELYSKATLMFAERRNTIFWIDNEGFTLGVGNDANQAWDNALLRENKKANLRIGQPFIAP